MAQELTLIIRAENMASQALLQVNQQIKMVSTTTGTATKANKAMGKSALTASKGINSMAGSTKRLMTAMVGASLIYGAVRAVKAATKEYVKYDKQIHNLWTLTDYTKEQMDSLGKRIRAMSLDFTESAADTTRAMYQIYSATFYGEDAFNILEESLKGAAAGLSDVFTVADMMTTVLNA